MWGRWRRAELWQIIRNCKLFTAQRRWHIGEQVKLLHVGLLHLFDPVLTPAPLFWGLAALRLWNELLETLIKATVESSCEVCSWIALQAPLKVLFSFTFCSTSFSSWCYLSSFLLQRWNLILFFIFFFSLRILGETDKLGSGLSWLHMQELHIALSRHWIHTEDDERIQSLSSCVYVEFIMFYCLIVIIWCDVCSMATTPSIVHYTQLLYNLQPINVKKNENTCWLPSFIILVCFICLKCCSAHTINHMLQQHTV